MGIDRRKFVKVAGLATLGLTAHNPLVATASEALKEAGKEEIKCAPGCVCAPPLTTLPENITRAAMVIDLKTCREHPDCNVCIDACHHVHNVPDYPDTKTEIKWIWKEHFNHAFPEVSHNYTEEHVKHSNGLLLCNHCDNPPCVKVCPTNATFKRESDGIVMMDWHRCIGCRYCIAGCPYGSRSFNFSEPKKYFAEKGMKPQPDFPMRERGVVEKCTFCDERLARGEWPACVEACPHNCITFGDLDNPKDPVRELLQHNFTIRRKSGLGTQPEVYYIV